MEQITINNQLRLTVHGSGFTVTDHTTMNHEPLTMNQRVGDRQPRPKKWRHHWKLFGRFHIYLTNCRMKPRSSNDDRLRQGEQLRFKDMRRDLLEQQDHKCPMCHQPIDEHTGEMHHILPWGRFPELRMAKTNHIALCHKCHKEVHCNPWLNIKMQQAKAQELGIDLKDHYNMEEC